MNPLFSIGDSCLTLSGTRYFVTVVSNIRFVDDRIDYCVHYVGFSSSYDEWVSLVMTPDLILKDTLQNRAKYLPASVNGLNGRHHHHKKKVRVREVTELDKDGNPMSVVYCDTDSDEKQKKSNIKRKKYKTKKRIHKSPKIRKKPQNQQPPESNSPLDYICPNPSHWSRTIRMTSTQVSDRSSLRLDNSQQWPGETPSYTIACDDYDNIPVSNITSKISSYPIASRSQRGSIRNLLIPDLKWELFHNFHSLLSFLSVHFDCENFPPAEKGGRQQDVVQGKVFFDKHLFQLTSAIVDSIELDKIPVNLFFPIESLPRGSSSTSFAAIVDEALLEEDYYTLHADSQIVDFIFANIHLLKQHLHPFTTHLPPFKHFHPLTQHLHPFTTHLPPFKRFHPLTQHLHPFTTHLPPFKRFHPLTQHLPPFKHFHPLTQHLHPFTTHLPPFKRFHPLTQHLHPFTTHLPPFKRFHPLTQHLPPFKHFHPLTQHLHPFTTHLPPFKRFHPLTQHLPPFKHFKPHTHPLPHHLHPLTNLIHLLLHNIIHPKHPPDKPNERSESSFFSDLEESSSNSTIPDSLERRTRRNFSMRRSQVTTRRSEQRRLSFEQQIIASKPNIRVTRSISRRENLFPIIPDEDATSTSSKSSLFASDSEASGEDDWIIHSEDHKKKKLVTLNSLRNQRRNRRRRARRRSRLKRTRAAFLTFERKRDRERMATQQPIEEPKSDNGESKSDNGESKSDNGESKSDNGGLKSEDRSLTTPPSGRASDNDPPNQHEEIEEQSALAQNDSLGMLKDEQNDQENDEVAFHEESRQEMLIPSELQHPPISTTPDKEDMDNCFVDTEEQHLLQQKIEQLNVGKDVLAQSSFKKRGKFTRAAQKLVPTDNSALRPSRPATLLRTRDTIQETKSPDPQRRMVRLWGVSGQQIKLIQELPCNDDSEIISSCYTSLGHIIVGKASGNIYFYFPPFYDKYVVLKNDGRPSFIHVTALGRYMVTNGIRQTKTSTGSPGYSYFLNLWDLKSLLTIDTKNFTSRQDPLTPRINWPVQSMPVCASFGLSDKVVICGTVDGSLFLYSLRPMWQTLCFKFEPSQWSDMNLGSIRSVKFAQQDSTRFAGIAESGIFFVFDLRDCSDVLGRTDEKDHINRSATILINDSLLYSTFIANSSRETVKPLCVEWSCQNEVLLCVGCNDSTIRFFEVSTDKGLLKSTDKPIKEVKFLSLARNPVSMAFVPDGLHLIVSDKLGSVYIYNLAYKPIPLVSLDNAHPVPKVIKGLEIYPKKDFPANLMPVIERMRSTPSTHRTGQSDISTKPSQSQSSTPLSQYSSNSSAISLSMSKAKEKLNPSPHQQSPSSQALSAHPFSSSPSQHPSDKYSSFPAPPQNAGSSPTLSPESHSSISGLDKAKTNQLSQPRELSHVLKPALSQPPIPTPQPKQPSSQHSQLPPTQTSQPPFSSPHTSQTTSVTQTPQSVVRFAESTSQPASVEPGQKRREEREDRVKFRNQKRMRLEDDDDFRQSSHELQIVSPYRQAQHPPSEPPAPLIPQEMTSQLLESAMEKMILPMFEQMHEEHNMIMVEMVKQFQEQTQLLQTKLDQLMKDNEEMKQELAEIKKSQGPENKFSGIFF
ncbi:hypothetical protein BLNAU_7015 [Blattamonas nauphoetae]|uniref:Uncharacterized protein n=1 Tax=Blattamonas nauphoetae TaxID=2049346 RepID=A0ABQ9Y312_9EUKA|nr:hypothetical protein BLNAU_7015 [Blattamonas nauphoetae]